MTEIPTLHVKDITGKSVSIDGTQVLIRAKSDSVPGGVVTVTFTVPTLSAIISVFAQLQKECWDRGLDMGQVLIRKAQTVMVGKSDHYRGHRLWCFDERLPSEQIWAVQDGMASAAAQNTLISLREDAAKPASKIIAADASVLAKLRRPN